MPWAGLTSELQIGPITFWSYQTTAKTKLSDRSIRDHLDRYFACYVDHAGKAARTAVVCTYKRKEFGDLSQKEASQVRMAVDALLFLIISDATKHSVCNNNRTMGPPSADRFELIAQDFQPGNDDISVRAGSVRSSGWKIGTISFPMPWCMGGSFGLPNQELVEGFTKAFKREFPHDLRNRLFRSLEWFRYAHTESDVVSPLSKVVMMATAFEIILNVPNTRSKKIWIAEQIEKRCAGPRSLKKTRRYGKGKAFTRPKIAWWAHDFYDLRNFIVHGDPINRRRLQHKAHGKSWITQLIVADIVFWECVTRELYDHKCIGANARSCSADWAKMFPNEPAGSIEANLANWFLGYDDVHRSLGWLPKLKPKR